MNNNKLVLFIAAFIAIIFFIVLYFILPEKNFDVSFAVKELPTRTIKNKVFIKIRNWGLTGDNQEIAISNTGDKDEKLDYSKNYIYKGLSPFYYKLQNDSLFVYVRKASKIPPHFKTELKIIQVELDNPQMMNLYENHNYKNEGLETIEITK